MAIDIRRLAIESIGLPEEVFAFSDDTPRILIGRDPDKCQVTFPAEYRAVGAVHCALTRAFDGYRLSYPERYPVLVNGKPARDGRPVRHRDQISLGEGGPHLRVEYRREDNLSDTAIDAGGAHGSILHRLRDKFGRRR